MNRLSSDPALADPTLTTVVETKVGRIRGRLGPHVARFLGIPYAAAPVGPGRLLPAKPASRWPGTLDGTRYGATAPKPPYYPPFDVMLPEPVIEGEEYLNLNVWTPVPARDSLPVMVYVHGGNFMNGSGAVPTYEGTNFARRGVVLVTFNYRLGAQGFLYAGEGAANPGLHDQIAALEWVQENIESFGGDPANVTLFGQSAGAHSVVMLMTAPRCRGLFQRVIAQSGSGKANSIASASRMARLVCNLLGVAVDLDVLGRVPAARLIDAQLRAAAQIRRASLSERLEWGEMAFSNIPFNPTIDGDLLPLPTLQAAAAGEGKEVDLLAGTNADELRLGMVPTGVADAITTEILETEAGVYGLGEGAVDLYRRERPGARAGDLLAAIRTDRLYRMPAIELGDRREASGARTWMYEFAWPSPALDGRLGACHLLDVPFVFGTLLTGGMESLLGPSPPNSLADVMQAAWTRFATTGNPGWPPYTHQRRTTMRFATEPVLVDDPRSAERKLWQRGNAGISSQPSPATHATLPWTS